MRARAWCLPPSLTHSPTHPLTHAPPLAGIALNKLGKLYAEKMNDPQQAAVHYQTNLELLDAEQVPEMRANRHGPHGSIDDGGGGWHAYACAREDTTALYTPVGVSS